MFFIQRNFYWLLPLVIIDVILKGIALWKAGRQNRPYWFLAIFIFNTLGILPAIYLLFFQKNKKK